MDSARKSASKCHKPSRASRRSPFSANWPQTPSPLAKNPRGAPPDRYEAPALLLALTVFRQDGRPRFAWPDLLPAALGQPTQCAFFTQNIREYRAIFPKLKKSPSCSNMVFFLLANVSFFCQSAPFLHSIHLNRTLVFKKTAYN